jgi:hypothetical protein
MADRDRLGDALEKACRGGDAAPPRRSRSRLLDRRLNGVPSDVDVPDHELTTEPDPHRDSLEARTQHRQLHDRTRQPHAETRQRASAQPSRSPPSMWNVHHGGVGSRFFDDAFGGRPPPVVVVEESARHYLPSLDQDQVALSTTRRGRGDDVRADCSLGRQAAVTSSGAGESVYRLLNSTPVFAQHYVTTTTPGAYSGAVASPGV